MKKEDNELWLILGGYFIGSFIGALIIIVLAELFIFN